MAWFLGFITWVVFCIVVAKAAEKRGRSFAGYLILSLFLSPLAGIIILLVLGDTDEKQRNQTINVNVNTIAPSNATEEHIRNITPNQNQHLLPSNHNVFQNTSDEPKTRHEIEKKEIDSTAKNMQKFIKFIGKNWKDVLLENGLEEYIDVFEKNKLTNLEILSELNENDLEKLGIVIMGDRKRILKIFRDGIIADNHSKNETLIPEEIHQDEKGAAKTLEEIFDENIMKEAKEFRRLYGKAVCISHLKNKAKELGLGDITINENDIE